MCTELTANAQAVLPRFIKSSKRARTGAETSKRTEIEFETVRACELTSEEQDMLCILDRTRYAMYLRYQFWKSKCRKITRHFDSKRFLCILTTTFCLTHIRFLESRSSMPLHPVAWIKALWTTLENSSRRIKD